MNRISIITLVILLAGVIFIGGFFFKLRPQYMGKVQDFPVQDSTEVLFDKFGVPHIYANSEEDAYTTLGYVHAQERLFQMELLRRVGAGRLSEAIGSRGLVPDKLFRRLGISAKAAYSAQRLENDSLSPWCLMAKAYLKGVNTFIDNGPTPLEFKALGIPKSHFELIDMYLIAGYMSFSFDRALSQDPMVTHIQDVLGPDYLKDLHLNTEEGGYEIPVFPLAPTKPDSSEQAAHDWGGFPVPELYGSNSWAIAGANTENGEVLFGNDTHIGYSQPSTWFEAHLEYPGYSFYGNFMAGIPFALIGHTKEITWGLTMFLNDDVDLYCEKLSADGKSYFFKGVPRSLNFREEVIKVKDSSDVILQVAHTHHGPIITESLSHLASNDEISCYWVYLESDNNLLEAFYRLNHAEDMQDARHGVSLIAAPGLNITYGDAEGNIAVWAAAKIPIRAEHVDPMRILNGFDGQAEIRGYHPFEMNPHVENPPWGYVYSANNKHQSREGLDYPGYYEPDDRASMISEKLAARTDWTVEAMKKLAMDTRSKEHKSLSQDLIQIMAQIGLDSLSEDERSAIRTVKEWDGEHRVDELGPSIYYRWLYHIFQSAMEDELGRETFKSILKANFIKSSMKEVICNKESIWWDNINTEDDVETRDQLIFSAFKKTITQMSEYYGYNQEDWQWGAYHQTLHKHMFNGDARIDWAVNVGPFPSPGGIETINNSMFYLNDDPVIYAQHGPQMRILLDFSDVENSVSISPTGQSGVVMSDHYDDQAEMYLRGAFRPQLMTRSKIEKEHTRVHFLPENE